MGRRGGYCRRLLVAFVIGALLMASGCGGGLADSPERFHRALKLFAKQRDYYNLLNLFTIRARARFEQDRHEMVLRLREEGVLTLEFSERKIGEWLRTSDGEPVDALGTFGFKTYKALADAEQKEVFKHWCENRTGWRERIDRMADSTWVACSTLGRDKALLTLRYPDAATETLELYRHKGRWYTTGNWLRKVKPL